MHQARGARGREEQGPGAEAGASEDPGAYPQGHGLSQAASSRA